MGNGPARPRLEAMFQVRIHGRGGQGVVTAAELLSIAAFSEGRQAQAFPTFGSERTGAPVVAFCRIDDVPIRSPRADRGARRADRPGSDAAPPGRRLQRPRRRRLPARQHRDAASTSSGSPSSSSGSPRHASLTRPRHRARARAPRPPAAERRAARRVRRADRLVSLDSVAAAIRERFAGRDRRAQRRRAAQAAYEHVPARGGSRPCLARSRDRRRSREAVALCRPEVICAYPISPADAHRRGALRPGPHGRARAVRVPERRVGVRRDVGRDRRLGRRRARVHGDGQPGPALHGRGALQRLRARAADRDDGREPGDRRADQHLERPQRRDVAARLRLDPALRRDEPGGGRPAHPGVPARRGAVAAGDGVHGRLRPHARRSSRSTSRRRSRSTRSCRRSSRGRCSTPTSR